MPSCVVDRPANIVSGVSNSFPKAARALSDPALVAAPAPALIAAPAPAPAAALPAPCSAPPKMFLMIPLIALKAEPKAVVIGPVSAPHADVSALFMPAATVEP